MIPQTLRLSSLNLLFYPHTGLMVKSSFLICIFTLLSVLKQCRIFKLIEYPVIFKTGKNHRYSKACAADLFFKYPDALLKPDPKK